VAGCQLLVVNRQLLVVDRRCGCRDNPKSRQQRSEFAVRIDPVTFRSNSSSAHPAAPKGRTARVKGVDFLFRSCDERTGTGGLHILAG
jgi:hypothetical protein